VREARDWLGVAAPNVARKGGGTPSKIRELQIKLYRKAKSEFPVQSRSTRHFSDGVTFVK
jgi:hypothetical protein